MKKILLLGHVAWLICLTACETNKWSWVARPYMADSETQAIWSSQGESVKASDPNFGQFTCFDANNIIELKQNIEALKIYRENRNDPKVIAIMNQINRAARLPEYVDDRPEYADMN
jgi:hypothetical protein